MKASATWRPLLATAVVFLLLTASYKLAVRWSASPPGQRLATAALQVGSVPGAGAPVSGSASQAVSPAAACRADQPIVLPTVAQLGHHRYEGTVDGRPVLAEVNIWLEASNDHDHHVYPALNGFFYDRATGVSSYLGRASAFRPDQWLETWDDYKTYTERKNVLCANQLPGGALLTGWCTQPGARRAVAVYLRERYTDGVRYEILHEESSVVDSPAHFPGARRVSQDYLHLLGSDTLRPALARLQCPPPAARLRARRALLARLVRADHFTTDERDLDVTLNEADLLACTVSLTQETGPRYYDQSSYRRLYDLRTGRELRLAEQLRPGGLRQLQLLLTRRALADTVYARHRDHWRRHQLLTWPNQDFELTPTSWTANYGESNPENSYGYAQELSWADVCPLLRATSPLQRLLQIRGLSLSYPAR
jgi:hypothetical protein